MFGIMKCCIAIFVMFFMIVHAKIGKHECNDSSDADRIAPRGGTVTLGCPITLDPGIEVEMTFWRKNNSPIERNATKYKINGTSLTISSLEHEDIGIYSCKILSSASKNPVVESKNITLFVPDLSVSHCRPGDSSCLIYGGNITNLTCSSSGYPRPPRTTWEVNGESLNSSAIDLTRYTHNLTLICKALVKCFPANKTLDVYYHLPASPVMTILLSVSIPVIGIVVLIGLVISIRRYRNRIKPPPPCDTPEEQELELIGRILRDRLQAVPSDSERRKLRENVITLCDALAASAAPESKDKETRKTAAIAEMDSVMTFVQWVIHDRRYIESEQKKDIFDIIISLHPDETGRFSDKVLYYYDCYSQFSSLHNQSLFLLHDSTASTSAIPSQAKSCPVMPVPNSSPDVGFNKEMGEHQKGDNSAPANISLRSIFTKSKRAEKRKRPTNPSAHCAQSLVNVISFMMKELEDMTEAKKADIHNQIAFEILPFFYEKEDQHVTEPINISTLPCDDGFKLLIEKLGKLNNPSVRRKVMCIMNSSNRATEETDISTLLKISSDTTNNESESDDPGGPHCTKVFKNKIVDLPDGMGAIEPLMHTDKNTERHLLDISPAATLHTRSIRGIQAKDSFHGKNTERNLRSTLSLWEPMLSTTFRGVYGRQAEDSSKGKKTARNLRSTSPVESGILPLLTLRSFDGIQAEDSSHGKENRETTKDERDEVTPKSKDRGTHKGEPKEDLMYLFEDSTFF